MESTECGATSLAMILATYGKYIPLEKLRIDTGVSRDGCNAKNILRGARKYGLVCKGYKRGLTALVENTTLPAIIHWNFNHFVVFEGTKGDYAYINDPAQGRRKLTMQDLDEGFTGIVLCFEPGAEFEKANEKKSLTYFIKERLKGQYNSLLFMIGIGLCLIFPGLVIPIFSKVFIDDILLGGNTSWLGALLVGMIGVSIFQMLLTLLRNNLLLKLQSKLSLLSTYKLLHHMFRLPISFFDQRYAGDLNERLQDNDAIANFLAGSLAQTMLNVIVAMFYFILLVIYNPLLTLIGIVAIICNFILVKYSSEKLSNRMMKIQQDQGKFAGVLFSGLHVIQTLKASGAENQYISRILGYYARVAKQEQEMGKMQQYLNAFPSFTTQFSSLLILIIGGISVINGDMTAGMLIAFNALMDSFTAPVNELVGFTQEIQSLKANMSRVQDIHQYEQDEKYASVEKEDMALRKLSGVIEAENIAFGYSILDSPLVQDLSFSLQSGQSVAFVGASGSGKSTIAKILSGLYTPWDGKVYFDGTLFKHIPSEILNSSIAMVSQDITIFSGSIRDNLTLWNKVISEEDMICAAKDACIHDVITKKKGAYDYLLNEGGSNLSGGQRQRLEIARALTVNPTILVMDEATSALDSITEKQIVDNIKRRGCTCIIVAHRLSAIRDCDEIIVMEKGRIIQRGIHSELAKVDGNYKDLISTI